MGSSNQDLTDLICQCAEGNQDAFEVLYKQLIPYLTSYAFGIVRCEALSDEVLQESFVQIWRSSARYNPQRGLPLSWICTIVRSRAIDKIRAEKRHQVGETFQENIEFENLVSKEQPELDLVEKQNTLNFTRHLEKLSPNEHLVVTLAYVHGYSRQELSQALDANINTVKSWLRRGLQHLKSSQGMAA